MVNIWCTTRGSVNLWPFIFGSLEHGWSNITSVCFISILMASVIVHSGDFRLCTVCMLVIQLFLTLCDPHGLYPTRLLCPRYSPGVEPNEFIYHLFKQSRKFRLRIRKQSFEIKKIWILSTFFSFPIHSSLFTSFASTVFISPNYKILQCRKSKETRFP